MCISLGGSLYPSLHYAPTIPHPCLFQTGIESTESTDWNVFSSDIAEVRTFITFHKCDKKRVLFSKTKLTNKEEHLIKRIQEEMLYLGSSLLAETSKLYKYIVKQVGLNCASPMEIQYYSGIKNSFLTSTRQSLQPTKLT